MTSRKDLTLFIWGLLDALYVIWYVATSMHKGSIPYISDTLSTLEQLQHQGMISAALISVSWLLQLSIIATAVLLVLRKPMVKWLCYAQIPFRLAFFVPSISLLLIAASMLSDYSKSALLLLLLISEAVKAFTLWRYT